jgi:hypothetical protein
MNLVFRPISRTRGHVLDFVYPVSHNIDICEMLDIRLQLDPISHAHFAISDHLERIVSTPKLMSISGSSGRTSYKLNEGASRNAVGDVFVVA